MMDMKNVYYYCAQTAHEANRTFCMAIGDPVQPHWEDAPAWQRESCVLGVIGIIEKMNTPEKSHQSWLAHKIETGWSYGPVKDETAKTHPCMVPYNALPKVQKEKDTIFHDTVKRMFTCIMHAVGDSVEPPPTSGKMETE